MSAAASRAAFDPDAPRMTIGEVMALLAPDYPDVTISKIRFLEEQGLVEPRRTAAGYRKFSSSDVDRLRYVLTAQRDHYLPLRVIRENLQAMDRGLQAPEHPAASPRVPEAVGAPAAQRFDGSAAQLRLTRAELLRESGVDAELLDALEGFGVLAPVPGGPWYDGEALEVLRAAAALAAHGIEARHLRVFRTAADREVALAEQVAAPLRRQRSVDSAARAEEVAREIAAACLRLHTALVAGALERATS
ncbi:MerR family transcriptional regulator [Paenibacillus sp. TRM 82003]|nr:MerR family transcriptional regulator [Kineococcus sp. TRM81007]MCI2240666.1 MerR family transcriptional regulator [Kineococcus sp. TRM81007]MCI3925412.1 MerR family transcriptional regulator [Paenibacillus sp. TRM 82003]